MQPLSAVRLLFVFLVLHSFQANAQVSPAEKKLLHYRLINFHVPGIKKESLPVLEIAAGNYADTQQFRTHLIHRDNYNTESNIVEVPSFGVEYTWRIVTNNPTTPALLHHFSTITTLSVDTAGSRIVITHPAETYTEGYFFVDRTRALYDMTGKAVWFLPQLPGVNQVNPNVRDLKLSPFGTLTLIADDQLFEVNWDGDVLWKGPENGKPNADTTERYHHEFTRLQNGHYMALGSLMMVLDRDTTALPVPDNGVGIEGSPKQPVMGAGKALPPTVRCPFGTVVEYDADGKLLWHWKSYDYFKGQIARITKKLRKPIDVHENAFYFDEKNGFVYVGFKNISQILKIKYPQGTVVATYGKTFSVDISDSVQGIFCDQHSCKLTAAGQLYVFNNNVCNIPAPPEVVVFDEQKGAKKGLKEVWRYQCLATPKQHMLKKKQTITSGGNVVELPDQSFFVADCMPYPDIFIVNKKKDILWSARPELWIASRSEWEPTGQYRASFIPARETLLQLIRNSGTKNINTTRN